jgi:hypothetical protein
MDNHEIEIIHEEFVEYVAHHFPQVDTTRRGDGYANYYADSLWRVFSDLSQKRTNSIDK